MLFQGVLLFVACATICPHARRSPVQVLDLHRGQPFRQLNTGVTGFFERRILQHKTGALEGFSKNYGCTRLVYYEGYNDAAKAIAREKQLKGWRREKKIALIEKMNPRWQDLAEHLGREMLLAGQSLKKTP